LLKPLEATAAKCLAPGLTLFRRFLNDAAQLALAGEVAELVLRAPWFVPRMPRSGKAYRYQAAHPFTGNAWPAIPSSVLNIWRAVAYYPHLPEACLVNLYDSSARMGLHQDRD
jgi:alkylated DNA repair protein (DNA oxidative demethylase)